jgi:hypothetical protein
MFIVELLPRRLKKMLSPMRGCVRGGGAQWECQWRLLARICYFPSPFLELPPVWLGAEGLGANWALSTDPGPRSPGPVSGIRVNWKQKCPPPSLSLSLSRCLWQHTWVYTDPATSPPATPAAHQLRTPHAGRGKSLVQATCAPSSFFSWMPPSVAWEHFSRSSCQHMLLLVQTIPLLVQEATGVVNRKIRK